MHGRYNRFVKISLLRRLTDYRNDMKFYYFYSMWNYNFYVYILTNPDKTTLYIGVTNDLTVRLTQHLKNAGTKKSFTGKYHCYLLVYYEHFSHIDHAIAREKEIKKWRREKKDQLIATTNPEWRFLNKEVMRD